MTDRDAERRQQVEEIFAWPLAREMDALDPLDRPMLVAQMIVRQRYAELHDPGCSEEMVRRRQEVTGVYLVPEDCTCWLSRCVLADCREPGAETGPRRVQKYTGSKQYATEEEGGEWETRPSIAITRPCPRCRQFVQVCEASHCMYCGTKVNP